MVVALLNRLCERLPPCLWGVRENFDSGWLVGEYRRPLRASVSERAFKRGFEVSRSRKIHERNTKKETLIRIQLRIAIETQCEERRNESQSNSTRRIA